MGVFPHQHPLQVHGGSVRKEGGRSCLLRLKVQLWVGAWLLCHWFAHLRGCLLA